MDLATGAMGSLLLKLGDLLTDEYKLQAGVKEDVQYLKRELTSMYAALRKVGDVPRDELDEQVKIWADDVRDLSYRMEDAVDKFLVRVQGAEPAIKPRKLKSLIKKMGNLFTKGKTRHEIADEIKGIKACVQEAADRRDRYRVDEVVANPASAATVDPRLLALYKDRKELVGIDEPLSKLTEMLTDGDTDVSKQLKIVSIVGFGGLGKTSLAKAVYDKLQTQFDCTAFVPVGRKPSVKKLLNEILFGINMQMYPGLDEGQLIEKLRGSLEKKRYFIVIDDIWDIEAWEIIRCAFVDNNCASRIVTTTRILKVATKTGEVYKLKPLSHDLSEELFRTRLFGGKNKGPCDQPTEVYEKMLYKCGGAPLAIITMASLLVSKPVELWSKVYNSIGFGYEDNKDVDNMRKILMFGYYDLPCHLRTCLLYLSIYPEDHLIEKDSLIWKWVAEGFVHEEPGVGLYEIGERYFNELINKSMIQPVEIPHYGIITGCRVHGIVLDIICLLSKEENFVTVLGSDEQYTTSRHNVRRLAVQHRVQPVVSTYMLQMRSLNAMCSAEMLPSLSCFQVLRVLSFEGRCDLNNTNHLDHLGKLVHLRYLRLGCIYMTELPENIGDLKFLVVLDLDNMGSLSKLPDSIGLLSQLKCLNICKCLVRVPDCIGNLTCLEELCLTNVEESSNFVTELGKLTELRKLRITQTLWLHSASSMKAWAESVAKLQKIQVIDISDVKSTGCDDATCCCWEGCVLSHKLHVLHMVYRQPTLLEKITHSVLPNLSHLSVHVDSPDLEIFGRFPELVTLCLDMPKGLHHDIMGVPGAFPKLRVLRTGATPGRFLEVAMLSLEFLDFCVQAQQSSEDGKVDDFDFGSLGNLPSLQKVAVEICYALSADLNKAEKAVRHAIGIFPPNNRPILQVRTYEAAHPELDLPRPSVADCILHLHQDISIQGGDRGEVKETAVPISASLGAMRPLITEASAEYAVKQSGVPERDGNNTVPDEARIFTSSNISTLLDVSIVEVDVGEVREIGEPISASLDAKRPLLTEASIEYAVKQSGAPEQDGNNTVLEETTSCNISTLFDVSIEDLGEVSETRGAISASLDAKSPLTEASAESAVKQSGAQERDRNNTILEEARIFTSSNILTLLHGSVSASLGAMRALVGKLDMLLLAPPQGCSSESVKDGMQLLREDVEEISSYLDELSELEDPPPTAKCWMNEAHDLSYDIEDYIDSLLFVQPAEPSNNVKGTRSRLKLSGHAKTPRRLPKRLEHCGKGVTVQLVRPEGD